MGSTPVAAAVIIHQGASFSVEITADEDVSIDCSTMFVRVTANGVPTVTLTLCSTVTSLAVEGGPGENTITLSAVAAADFPSLATVTISGGGAGDVLTGSAIGDEIAGDAGMDTIRGFLGIDLLSGGPDGDTFFWDPGDGNDIVTGDDGFDILLFNGASGAEVFTVKPEGSGFDVLRNVGNVTIDADTVENLTLQALGADDSVSTVPLPVTLQSLNGGTQTVTDTVAIDFTGYCFAETGGEFVGVAFGLIATTGFETFDIVGSPGECTTADIDLNGMVAPLTDGLLLLRYFFGFRGATLTTNAVAGDCGRCSAAEIEAYIQGLY